MQSIVAKCIAYIRVNAIFNMEADLTPALSNPQLCQMSKISGFARPGQRLIGLMLHLGVISMVVRI